MILQIHTPQNVTKGLTLMTYSKKIMWPCLAKCSHCTYRTEQVNSISWLHEKMCLYIERTCVCLCVFMCVYERGWVNIRQTQKKWDKALGIDRPSSSLCDYRSISPQTACDLSEWARFSDDWQFTESCHRINLNPHSTQKSLIPFSLSLPFSLFLSLIHKHTHTHTHTHTRMDSLYTLPEQSFREP